jgi:predicted RNase H-like nuclease (RuvC/YqgF family)
VTNKERAEMMNLRKRVESQRSEIKRLTDEISRLREEIKWAKAHETD